MITREQRWLAFKEACVDTAAGAAINIPVNWMLLVYAFSRGMTPLETTILITGVITTIAITRKMFIRLHFHKRSMNDSL
jgi:hypothetical protein